MKIGSSGIPINKRKYDNRCGLATVATDTTTQLLAFVPKYKKNQTFRSLFGDCSWADPFSYSDIVYIASYYLGNAVNVDSPYYSGLSDCFILDNSLGPFTDAITGQTSSETICYVATSDFSTDIGNVLLQSSIVVVQTSLGGGVNVAIENGNLATLYRPIA
jgi:hypothetical protein